MSAHAYEVALFGEFFAKDLPGVLLSRISALKIHTDASVKPSLTVSPYTASRHIRCISVRLSLSRSMHKFNETLGAILFF